MIPQAARFVNGRHGTSLLRGVLPQREDQEGWDQSRKAHILILPLREDPVSEERENKVVGTGYAGSASSFWTWTDSSCLSFRE